MKKQSVDVLWFVEHVAREMDVACAVKALAASRMGLDITIRNMYYHAAETMERYQPRVVVHPFFYHLEGALATEDFVATWPDAVHFNLAWEQIHYKAQWNIKAPADDFTRKQVIHHAWGPFYKSYLMQAGVGADAIFVNGQPAYQLYRYPYRRYYRNRDWLSQSYGLDPRSRWIFVPENYRWAFIGNKIKYFTKLGGNPREMEELRDFCFASLREVLRWCNLSGSQNGITIIFRPRPAVNSAIMRDFFVEHVGVASPNLRFIKGESVREWILASDVVVSSYSTSLIEAAVAGRPVAMLEPLSIPESLHCDWYELVPRLRTRKDFHRLCLAADQEVSPQALRSWAESEMLGRGDPILGLVQFIKKLVHEAPAAHRSESRPLLSGEKRAKSFFNEKTHENDVFDEGDIQIRVVAWTEALSKAEADLASHKKDTLSASADKGFPLASAAPESPLLSVIICTFNRSGLLDKCLESVVTDDTAGREIEVIVVDNNSTDDTKAVVERYRRLHPNVRHVQERQQGLSHARNRGCEEADGRFLVYLDDDAMIPKGYLLSVCKVLFEHNPDIVGGPVYPYYDAAKPKWFKDEYEVRKFALESGFSESCRVSGGNFIIKRDLLIELGRFDVDLGMKGTQIGLGEERALLNVYRKKTPKETQKVYYCLDCHILHYVPRFKMTRRYMTKRSYKAGRTMFRIKKKAPDSVFRHMKSFFPEQFNLVMRAVQAEGVWKADYANIIFEAATRLGNIVELLSKGWRPVLTPHVIVQYGKIRVWLKKQGYKRLLLWFEKKFGIEW